MNREFEILNEKLNILFEELMWLRRDFQKEKYFPDADTGIYNGILPSGRCLYPYGSRRVLFADFPAAARTGCL